MDEATRNSINQELVAIDEKIAALNEEIRNVCWRQSPAGNRRQISAQDGAVNGLTNGHAEGPPVAPRDGQATHVTLRQSENERRLPATQRISVLRLELSLALQRYLTLHSLLERTETTGERV